MNFITSSQPTVKLSKEEVKAHLEAKLAKNPMNELIDILKPGMKDQIIDEQVKEQKFDNVPINMAHVVSLFSCDHNADLKMKAIHFKTLIGEEVWVYNDMDAFEQDFERYIKGAYNFKS